MQSRYQISEISKVWGYVVLRYHSLSASAPPCLRHGILGPISSSILLFRLPLYPFICVGLLWFWFWFILLLSRLGALSLIILLLLFCTTTVLSINLIWVQINLTRLNRFHDTFLVDLCILWLRYQVRKFHNFATVLFCLHDSCSCFCFCLLYRWSFFTYHFPSFLFIHSLKLILRWNFYSAFLAYFTPLH